MSCSIDSRRGSILMEFVLVLPIYLFLFGALYLLGDMGLNAIRISTGDRDAAMDAGDRTGQSMSQFLTQQMRDERSKARSISSTYRTNENFRGSWSWQAAGRTSFAYKLPTYGGGALSYPYLRYGGSTSGGGLLGTLVGGGTVVFHSKDYSLGNGVRAYNYYTIKRTDLARDPKAYRNWDSWNSNGKQDTSRSYLVDSASGRQYWYSGVYEEAFADSNPASLDSRGQGGGDSLPSRPSGRKEYNRFSAFVTWSQ